jgi:hypothetical protein
MDKWLAAASALGGLAAIGGLIDLAMYQAEKDRLKARLEDWWLRFTDVRWSNFGRHEAELAIEIIDRRAGPRLWSWKRWRFAAYVSFAVAVLTAVWVCLRAVWSGADVDLGLSGDLKSPIARLSLGIFALSLFAAFAISLSVTRYVAVLAARLSTTPVRTVLSFTVLLVVHVLLLIYWSVVIYGLQAALVVVVMRGLTLLGVTGFAFFPDSELAQRIFDVFSSLFWPDQDREGIKVAPVMWSALFSLSHTKPFSVSIVWLYAFKVAMDIVANGLRILLALVFLSSFLFRPLIQAPISRLWYGAMASDRPPVFTLLFGTAGAIIGAVQVMAG